MTLKPIIFKFFALFTATLVLIASFSFTVNSHYCMGMLKDRSINSAADTCITKMQKDVSTVCADARHSNHDHELTPFQEFMKKRGCCDDSQLIVDGDIDYFPLKNQVSNLGIDLHFIYALAITQFGFNSTNVTQTPHLNYKPPLLYKDIPILVQSFLC